MIKKGDTLRVRMATPFKHPRTGVYYLRRAVPKAIQEALGKTEFLKTLGIKDARTLAGIESNALLAVEKRFQEQQKLFRRAEQVSRLADFATSASSNAG